MNERWLRTPRARKVGALLLASVLALLASGAALQDGARIDDVRTARDKWVETRRLISRESRDWATGKELLLARIELVRGEIASLRARIDEAAKSATDADEKVAELAAEKDALAQAASSLQGTVETLEARTRALLARLPDPIRERVRPLSQSLPREAAATELSLGQRFQNVVGILNEVNKFNREISVTSEVRELGDGATAEVTALYVGIGQGYYVTAKGDAAGIGSASAEGWTWSPRNDAAPQIARAIRILRNEAPADFVRVPVRIE
jgi:hypothetical protein